MHRLIRTLMVQEKLRVTFLVIKTNLTMIFDPFSKPMLVGP